MPLLACPLLNTLMGEAVASGPIRTLRARSALWVVHAFFVRAADNLVGHDSGAGSVRLEEGQNLLTDGEILAYVQVVIGEPALEKIWVVLSDHFKSGQRLSLQNRPTEVAVQD